MKIMTVGEMLSLSVPDESSLTVAQERLRPITADGSGLDWIADGLRAGSLKVREAQVNGKPRYVYFWSLTKDNFLEVNASVFVGEDGQNDKWLWCLGAEMIARELNCRGIILTTARRGHVEQCLRGGYSVVGLRMSKVME